MLQDSIIVQEILAGNSIAFGDLVRKYYTSVYRQVEAMLGNRQDSQEVTQDVFVKALENLASLREYSSFEAWIRTIARRECQSLHRRSRERPFSAFSDDLPDESRGVEDEMILGEALRDVISAIDELSEAEKRLLRERYLEGASYQDLQKSHGLSYKAITMRILRARQKVRLRVGGETIPDLHLSPEQESLIAVSLQSATSASTSLGDGGIEMNNTPFDFRAPLAARIEGKFGYLNKDGQIVIPAQFDRAMGFCEGLARVGIGEKQGYIDEKGQIVIPLKFDEAHPFCEGLAGARVGEKFGFIDKSGEFVIDPEFDVVEHFSEGRAAVKVGEKWGYVDREGRYVAKPQFDKVWHFNDGVAPVNRGNEHGYIDKEGKSIYFWQTG